VNPFKRSTDLAKYLLCNAALMYWFAITLTSTLTLVRLSQVREAAVCSLQQLGLQNRWHLGDLVEQDCAVIADSNFPGFDLTAPVNSTLLVTKKFLSSICGMAAIDLQKLRGCAPKGL